MLHAAAVAHLPVQHTLFHDCRGLYAAKLLTFAVFY
jgi:hypothetical protein